MNSPYHAHTHHHSHDSEELAEKNIHNRAFKWGIGLNFFYVIIELTYGFKIDSLALIADATHNFGDVCGLVVAWLGLILLSKKPSPRMTFGLKKFSILAAFANSFLLIATTFWILKEGIERYQNSATLPGLTIIIVAGIGLIINFTTAMLFHQQKDKDLNMKAAFLHLLSDAFVSAGVIVSGIIIYYKGYAWVDPLSSVLIAIFIFISTWGIFKESFKLLMGGVPKKINPDLVIEFLEKQNGIQDVHSLHIWALSTTENMMVAHLVMPGEQPTDQFLAGIKHELTHLFPIKNIVFQIEKSRSGCN